MAIERHLDGAHREFSQCDCRGPIQTWMALTNDRPDVVGDRRLASGRPRGEQLAQFFNTAAFAKPAAGVLYGNAGRNVLMGPNAVSFNVSASKDYRIGEGQKRLQFRTDFFNVFNEVNLGNPNTALNNANFGKITSAAAPAAVAVLLAALFLAIAP